MATFHAVHMVSRRLHARDKRSKCRLLRRGKLQRGSQMIGVVFSHNGWIRTFLGHVVAAGHHPGSRWHRLGDRSPRSQHKDCGTKCHWAKVHLISFVGSPRLER